jgi:hypothetical protein
MRSRRKKLGSDCCARTYGQQAAAGGWAEGAVARLRPSNATCILFVAIVKLQCSHPVLHSKTSINTSRPTFSVYLWFKPLPGEKCLQSVFAICNCNRTILARTPPWGECLQSVFAICNCNRTILARTLPLPGGRMPAECICNLQLQPSICNWATEHLQLQPNICNCNRASAVAAEHLQLQPNICNCSGTSDLQLQPSICNCN